MSWHMSQPDPCWSLKQNRLFLCPNLDRQPQKHGSCSSTSGMSLAVWYAARVFSSAKRDGERTSAAIDNMLALDSCSAGCSDVFRNENQAIPAMIATARIPRIRFCLFVDFTDSPFSAGRGNHRLEHEKDFAFFLVAEFGAVFHRFVQFGNHILQ